MSLKSHSEIGDRPVLELSPNVLDDAALFTFWSDKVSGGVNDRLPCLAPILSSLVWY